MRVSLDATTVLSAAVQPAGVPACAAPPATCSPRTRVRACCRFGRTARTACSGAKSGLTDTEHFLPERHCARDRRHAVHRQYPGRGRRVADRCRRRAGAASDGGRRHQARGGELRHGRSAGSDVDHLQHAVGRSLRAGQPGRRGRLHRAVGPSRQRASSPNRLCVHQRVPGRSRPAARSTSAKPRAAASAGSRCRRRAISARARPSPNSRPEPIRTAAPSTSKAISGWQARSATGCTASRQSGKPELILEDVVPGHVDRVETARVQGKFDREHFYMRSGHDG